MGGIVITQRLNFKNNTLTIYELISMLLRGDETCLNGNTTLNETQMSKIVEGVLLNIPIGYIFLVESNEIYEYKKSYKFMNKYYIIKTIYDFLENKFQLCDLQILNNFNGLNIRNLEDYYTRRIQDYMVDVMICVNRQEIEKYKQKLQTIIDVIK